MHTYLQKFVQCYQLLLASQPKYSGKSGINKQLIHYKLSILTSDILTLPNPDFGKSLYCVIYPTNQVTSSLDMCRTNLCAILLLLYCSRIYPYLCQAVCNFAKDRGEAKSDKEYYVSFVDVPTRHKVRELSTTKIGTLVRISGQVVRTHPVHPELVLGTFICLDCQTVVKDVEQQFKVSYYFVQQYLYLYISTYNNYVTTLQTIRCFRYVIFVVVFINVVNISCYSLITTWLLKNKDMESHRNPVWDRCYFCVI